MTTEEKEFLAEQFKNMNEKMDLLILPVKSDITNLKDTVHNNTIKINTLELFKEGHQQHHVTDADNKKAEISTKRWNWEIIAGSGIISGMFFYLFGK
jgi:hypothetical protein